MVPVDSGATFAAHQEGRRFTIDRPANSPPDTIRWADTFRGPGDPAFAWRQGDAVRAAYWVDGARTVTVRDGTSVSAQPGGAVLSSWDENAIRLRFQPVTGAVLLTDTFDRLGGGTGPARLSRATQTILDIRGDYRAVVRDTEGTDVGWLRVRVGPYQAAQRVYDGALPRAVSNELAAAAMLALADEIDWIERRSYNVYDDSTRTGPLLQSFPFDH